LKSSLSILFRLLHFPVPRFPPLHFCYSRVFQSRVFSAPVPPPLGSGMPEDVVSAPTFSSFRRRLKPFFFQQSYPDIIIQLYIWHYSGPCEGVSIRLRFSVSAPLSAWPLTNMYFGIFLKNYCPDSFEIFSVFRGHRCHQNLKILRESDEGIFRGRVVRKIFDPLYLPYGGSWDPKFLHTLGPLRALVTGT